MVLKVSMERQYRILKQKDKFVSLDELKQRE